VGQVAEPRRRPEEELMETKIDEIAPDVFRLSTLVPEVAAPAGFTFNQFLVRDEEPFLFHTGMRQLFPLVSAAVERILPVESLRWISFGHVEADECGAMNAFLAAAPNAEVAHGELTCMVSLNDLADRPPRAMSDDVLDLGSRRLRFIPTPHVPHNWESGLWFDETNRVLFAGDLFTALGDGPAVSFDDLIEGAITAESVFHATSLGPAVPATLHRLADLGPSVLAVMHGSSYSGDGAAQLLGLADAYAAMGAAD
jgi:flavorubredoxin